MITWGQIVVFILFIVAWYIYLHLRYDRDATRRIEYINQNELPDPPIAETVNFEGLLTNHSAETTMITLYDGSQNTEMRLLKASGADVFRLWSELRAIVHHTKAWPVIIGDKEALQELQERLSPGYFEEDISTEQMLAASSSIEPSKWFAERPGDNSYYQIEEGEWKDNVLPNNVFKININSLRGQPFDEVYIVLVPTINSWEAPAYLRFGWGNNNPKPEEHVAVLKHWNTRYGAEVVSSRASFIELRSTRPPEDKKECMALAREQFIYCPDLAHGLGNLSALGSLLCKSCAWNFWWD